MRGVREHGRLDGVHGCWGYKGKVLTSGNVILCIVFLKDDVREFMGYEIAVYKTRGYNKIVTQRWQNISQ